MPTYKAREMFRGDTLDFDLDPVLDPVTRAPKDLTGSSIWFTAKNNYVDPDNQAVIALTLVPTGNGATSILDALRGLAHVTVNPLATRAQPDGIVRLVYDVQLKDAAGKLSTLESGTLKIFPDVSRAI